MKWAFTMATTTVAAWRKQKRKRKKNTQAFQTDIIPAQIPFSIEMFRWKPFLNENCLFFFLSLAFFFSLFWHSYNTLFLFSVEFIHFFFEKKKPKKKEEEVCNWLAYDKSGRGRRKKNSSNEQDTDVGVAKI